MAKATIAHRVDTAAHLTDRINRGDGLPSNRSMPSLPRDEVIKDWLENHLPGSVSDDRLIDLRDKVDYLREKGLISSSERL